MKILKTVTILALVGLGLSYAYSNRILSNITISFSGFRFIDFWKNLVKLKLEWVATLTVENRNAETIEVLGFDGNLTYRDENVSNILLDNVVSIPTNTRQPIKFGFKTDIVESAARLFLASRDKTSFEGGMITGVLRVKIGNLTVNIPYSEPTSITI